MALQRMQVRDTDGPTPSKLLTSRRGIYKVLKIGTASATQRETAAVERLGLARSQWEHQSKHCVRHPDRILALPLQGQMHRCFKFEPLGPSLLEFTSCPTNQPFGSEKVHWIAVYILHALDFLHSNGIVHAGQYHSFHGLELTL